MRRQHFVEPDRGLLGAEVETPRGRHVAFRSVRFGEQKGLARCSVADIGDEVIAADFWLKRCNHLVGISRRQA